MADIELNATELAAACHVSPRQITHWVRAGMPVKLRGRKGVSSVFALHDVLPWIIQYELEKRLETLQNPEIRDELAQEQLRLVRGRADQQEITVSRMAGELAEIKTFEAIMAKVLVTQRVSLLPLAGRLATWLENATDRAVIRSHLIDEFKRVLNVCADQVEASLQEERGNTTGTTH